MVKVIRLQGMKQSRAYFKVQPKCGKSGEQMCMDKRARHVQDISDVFPLHNELSGIVHISTTGDDQSQNFVPAGHSWCMHGRGGQPIYKMSLSKSLHF